ncbi:MAG: protein kinase family protein [Planctomycetota bacterium]|nr:protein kinase family protein [Planctomycetota bacterium]
MQDSDSNRPSSTNDATGSWKPTDPAAPLSGGDPPTVRTGQAAGGGSSSFRRQNAGLRLPQPGDRLESFELERAIGVGGMGAVYLATDTRLHREVALKILPPEQSNDSDVVQRFYQEGRAAARLDHENIARVYTIGGDKGYHFIAFEYIEGTTLRQRVHERGPLPVDEAINYTLQIAGALVHASERGVVHRDIKPSNIIVTPQGRAKLVDMGLARKFERGDDDGGLTESGMTLGTFDYISPEQARDPRDVDVRGDLYSLGCTLFHMLTGRPPFPEGTVLQKLLQHQEEPPPNVRLANPAVPEDLAAILVKLMAKDRERRYQTPELLVRDLLTVAGALGLRSLSPEGLVWMGPKAPPAWEKHLVWGIPAAALVAVVAMLVWSGQSAETSQAVEALPPAMTGRLPIEPPKPATVLPEKAVTKLVGPPSLSPAPGSQTPRERPRELSVKTGEQLAAAIAREASGSTVILSDDGPYVLPPSTLPPRGRRDLKIRAAAGVKPVLKFAQLDKASGPGVEPALLAFGPGSVSIEDVEFSLDEADLDISGVAIRGEGTDLILKRCTFRRGSSRTSSLRHTAVQLRPSPGQVAEFDEMIPIFRAEACHVDGGMVGFWVRGAADLRLRDCTLGPQEPSFWFDNGGSATMVPVDLSLQNVSIQADAGPILQSSRTTARITVDSSVFATNRDRTATLVEIDGPDNLDWRGKFNLYAGIETFLKLSRELPGRESIRSFSAWSDGPAGFRDVRSLSVEGPVWDSADLRPAQVKANPSLAFALLIGERPVASVGARRGPRGRIASKYEGLAGLLGLAFPVRPRTAPPSGTNPGPKTTIPGLGKPTASNNPAVASLPGKGAAPNGETEPKVAEIKPMARDEEVVLAPMGRDPLDAAPADTPKPPAPPVDLRPKPEPVGNEPVIPAVSDAIRTPSEFLAGLERLGTKGGTLKLAADADIRLSSCELRGMGKWVIQAEEGATRPRLRFRPGAADPRHPSRRPALFHVRSGSLELQGVDVILEESEAPPRGEWGAFAVWAGTDLSLTRCTVTIEGRHVKSAMVIVLASDDEPENGLVAADSSSSQVRGTDCLLRGGGDLVDVAAGRRLDLELTNVVVGTGGSLIHGHGLSRGQTPEPVKMILRQVSARAEGGLAFLESAPGEPELPQAEVVARDAILATKGPEAPLVRVDGQDGLEMLRDRVKWEGHGVLYHDIEVYRVDQTARTGTLPLRFDRQSWDVAIAPREESPFHGDVKFRNDWAPERSPATLTRDDAALDRDGPSPTAGPDTKRIPPAPGKRAVTTSDPEK